MDEPTVYAFTYRPALGLDDPQLIADIELAARSIAAEQPQPGQPCAEIVIDGPTDTATDDAIAGRLVEALNAIRSTRVH